LLRAGVTGSPHPPCHARFPANAQSPHGSHPQPRASPPPARDFTPGDLPRGRKSTFCGQSPYPQTVHQPAHRPGGIVQRPARSARYAGRPLMAGALSDLASDGSPTRPHYPTGMLTLLGPHDCCASAAGRGRDRITTIPPLDGRASRRHLGQAADGSAKRVSRQGDG
jgi:hypothetical protein